MVRAHRGVALVTALLVVALATTAVASLALGQQMEIRRGGVLIDDAALYQQALGVEAWAAGVLLRDRGAAPGVDHLGEGWNTPLVEEIAGDGRVQGRLEDAQGRFNLNNLVLDQQQASLWLVRYRRLLVHLGLDPALADALLDWMDADQEVRFPGGAEDAFYLAADPPYRSADRPLVSPRELILVKGYVSDVVARLSPHVVALPAVSAVNVNTATAPVLMSLGEGVTEADAEQLIEVRGESGFESLERFLQDPALAGRGVSPEGLTLASDYFLLDASARRRSQTARFESLLMRSEGQIRIAGRMRLGAT